MPLATETLGFAPVLSDYRQTWELQKRYHEEVLAGDRRSTILLLEHSPVYTAGKRTEDFERPTDGTDVIDVDRGGKITFHGPGQIVAYLWQAGVRPFAFDGAETVKVDLANEEAKKVVKFWGDLVTSGTASNDADFNDSWYQGLANGKWASLPIAAAVSVPVVRSISAI